MDFENLEERLENWSRVVRSPRFQSGECAAWAKLYVALRDAEKMRDVPAMTKDERDGWLVEKAWAALPNHTYKLSLKYHYIWRMDLNQVSTKLRKSHDIITRGIKMELVMSQAKSALRKSIAKLTAKELLDIFATEGCKQETCSV
jgi:hypothetical protein